MDNNDIQLITNKLGDIIRVIKRVIDVGIDNGTFSPESELCFRWKVEDFAYSDTGIISSRANGEYLSKDSWLRTSVKIKEAIENDTDYIKSLEEISTLSLKCTSIKASVSTFVGKIIHEYLNDERKSFNEALMTQRFVDDIQGKPVLLKAEVYLQGVALKIENIELSSGITIRKPVKADLEKESPYYLPLPTMSLSVPNPSAIVNIEFLGKKMLDIQKKVNQLIVILRLYKVGSIKYISYKTRSDSMTDLMMGGTITSGGYEQTLETALLGESDIEKIKAFWDIAENNLPQNLFSLDAKEINPISLAYDRYSDALMHNGLIERRIANVIMGLEALLGNVESELSYRLSLRVAKVMSILGYDPHEVRRIVKDAYNIRSLFAHGRHLSHKEKRSLEGKYKDVKTVLLITMNYLRQIIILMALSRRDNDEFIDLVDDSFIDSKRAEELNNIISMHKAMVQ